ncbi:hypothetical protein [Hyalangium versicolor]|uniref:hypothetical protein n=1 Tax=Hyalangium versicolor TaxID=2861190 RepID=UPI001CCD6211|nr:hypothetical protein [Hyalangium versicolor]
MDADAWNKEDDFVLQLYSFKDPLARGFEGLEELLDIIESLDEELRPDQMHLTARPQKYSRQTLRERFHKNRIGAGTGTILARSRPPKVSVWLDTFDGETDGVRFALKLRISPFSFLHQGGKASEHAEQLVSLVRAVAARLPLAYGLGHSFTDFTLSRKPNEERSRIPQRITEAFWLNLYGAHMQEELGRDRVLSTPASRMEELPGGAVLWLTQTTPVDFDSEEARAAQARSLIHLRPDLNPEATLAALRERSLAFAPIPMEFHPDVAEILRKEVDFQGLLRKRQTVERFNRYQPPPVAEWLPAAQVLQTDMTNVKASVETYEGLYAEQLIALFHTEVPEVLQTIPEALPALDWRLWHFGWGEHPSAEKKEALISALGAWLGRYLVHKLGGHWVPRRELAETAVVVEDSVWLPFLRARHALQSSDAPLDFSCTQFVREAQRRIRTTPL